MITDYIKFRLSQRMVDRSYGGGNMTVYEVEEVANNVFSDSPVDYIFWGGSRYRKIFVHNSHSTDSLVNAKIFILKDSDAEDSLSLCVGTNTDVVSDASDYSTWHKVGVLLTTITGSIAKREGSKTKTFQVSCVEGDSSGFYSSNYIYVSDGSIYDILSVSNVSWVGSKTANITVYRAAEHSYEAGAVVSSLCEISTLGPGESVPVWIKQYIPSSSTVYDNSNPIIGLLGV